MTWLRAALAAAVFTPVAAAADWPQWLGPKRDGGSSEAVEVWKDAPKAAWKAKVGAGFSSPVVAGGKVFVHARVPGKDREEVIAFDAKTGKEAWRAGYDRPPYQTFLNPGPRATPTVAGGKVFAFGITGTLAACDAESGKLLWHIDAFKKLGATLPRYGVCCSPLVVGNRVLVAVGGKGSSVAAFDTDTGDVAWQGLDEAANTSSPVLFTANAKAGKLPDAVFMTSLRVVGLNPLDGSVSWEYPLPFQPSGASPTPIVSGGQIVTSTMTNGSTAIRVAAGEKPTAEKGWQAKGLSGYFSSGVAAGKDRLYLVTNTLKPVPRADLACVDAGTGKVVWRKEGAGYFHFGLIRTGNDRLLILDDAGTLKLVDASAGEYRELCSAKVCEGTLVTPAFADGRVYARDDRELVCVPLSP
jgi:outer membrane protein assembly factor BamB